MKDIREISNAFVEGLKRILGDKLHAAYIYGAVVSPDSFPTTDIDFHVILNDELSESERSEIERFHEELGEKYPPLGSEFDGYYILLKDARSKSSPQSQMWVRAIDNSWALHRHHILAGRCANLYGPPPEKVFPAPSWSETERALGSELDYVANHLHQYPHYCILNLCRLIYSYQTRDVVLSKAEAAEWGRREFPQWKKHIDLSKKWYSGEATSEEMSFLKTEVQRFFGFAMLRIEEARQSAERS
jgi:predicted nucleotidyltransferase